MRRWIPLRIVFAVSGVAVWVGLPSNAPAQGQAPEEFLVEVLVDEASTPEQHSALAAHYRRRAQESREEASYHRSLGARYAKRPGIEGARLSRHCRELAETEERVAEVYERLSIDHTRLAAK